MTTALERSRDFMIAANKLPTMWALSEEFDQLIALLEDPEQDQDAIELELRRVAGDIQKKAHGVATVIQALEGLAEFQKAAADRMRAKAKANESHADRLRAYALECMRSLGQERIETGAFTLTVRQNPGRIEVVDPALVPAEFQKTVITTTVDKIAVMQAVKKDGAYVPGTELVKTERLEIR